MKHNIPRVNVFDSSHLIQHMLTNTCTHTCQCDRMSAKRKKEYPTTHVWVIVIVGISFGSRVSTLVLSYLHISVSVIQHAGIVHTSFALMSACCVFVVDRGMVQDMVFEAFVLFCSLTSKLIARWCFSLKWILNRCWCCFISSHSSGSSRSFFGTKSNFEKKSKSV